MMSSTMLGLLSLQFILGMISTLYTKFPETTDQAELWRAANSDWATLGHMIVGTLIVILGLVLVVKGAKLKKPFSMLTLIAFVAVLIAAFGGEEFVRTQNDVYSMVMAVGFIVSMGVYGRLLAAALVSQAKGQ